MPFNRHMILLATVTGLASASMAGAVTAQEVIAPAEAQQAAPAERANDSDRIAAFVDAQFPAADIDGDGELAAPEFTEMMMRLKMAELEQSGQSADKAAIAQYASDSFALADLDANHKITRSELTSFLGG